MSATALLETQAGVFALLTGDLALMQMVVGILDYVKDGQAFPYVEIGELVEVPDRTMGQNGHEITFLLTIWTRDAQVSLTAGPAGYRQAQQIAERVVALMTNDDDPDLGMLAVDGHAVVLVEAGDLSAMRDVDGITRHIDIHCKIVLEDA